MTHDGSKPLPELHLVGKVAAGKTALLRALTGKGAPSAGFGRGTCDSHRVDLPSVAPVLRLVDGPGLDFGSPWSPPTGGGVLAVARLDDPVQAPLERALAMARRSGLPVVALALTGAERLPEPAARRRAAAAIAGPLRRAAGAPDLPAPELALRPDGGFDGIEPLVAALAEGLPAAAVAALNAVARRDEAAAFAGLRPLVWRHAAGAGAADLVPLAGALAVPAAQAALLAALARARGVPWTGRRAGAFAAALGTATLARQGAAMALRQGFKLVPVVGQTLGAAAAGAASAAATFALGRAAHAWLWAEAQGGTIDADALRALYRQTLREAVARAPG